MQIQLSNFISHTPFHRAYTALITVLRRASPDRPDFKAVSGGRAAAGGAPIPARWSPVGAASILPSLRQAVQNVRDRRSGPVAGGDLPGKTEQYAAAGAFCWNAYSHAERLALHPRFI